MFRAMNVRIRLIVAFTLLTLLAIGSVIFCQFMMKRMDDAFQNLTKVRLRERFLVNQIQSNLFQGLYYGRDYLVSGNEDGITSFASYVGEAEKYDKELLAFEKKNYGKPIHAQKIGESIAAYKQLFTEMTVKGFERGNEYSGLTQEVYEGMNEVELLVSKLGDSLILISYLEIVNTMQGYFRTLNDTNLKKIKKDKNSFLSLLGNVDEQTANIKTVKAKFKKFFASFEALVNVNQEMDGIWKKMEKSFEEFTAFSKKILDEKVKATREEVERVNKTNKQSFYLTLILEGAMILLALILSFFLIRSIMRPLRKTISELQTRSEDLNETSDSLNSSAQKLANSADDQAAATQETVSAMAEMNSMIAQTVDFSQKSSTMSDEIRTLTNEGEQTMKQMVNAMDLIKDSNAQLEEMANIINEISNKTNVINDIVFKTQLLSFNASIEAARAGQHGKGFAVVAEEVGNLAQLSGNAAAEIRSLLENSQSQVNHIVTNTTGKVNEGEEVSRRAMEIFSKISESIGNISSQIHQISQATNEQKQGIEQTQQALEQIDNVMKVNQGISQETNTASKSLDDISTSLMDEMKDLVAFVLGQNASMKDIKMEEEASSSEGPTAAEKAHIDDSLLDSIVSKKDTVGQELDKELDNLDLDKDFD